MKALAYHGPGKRTLENKPIPVITSPTDAIVMLSDILPTGSECGVLNGQVKPGDTVAIVGGGPVGLAALLTAQFYFTAERSLLRAVASPTLAFTENRFS